MSAYTIHEPLPRKNETSAAPERFIFVRDGFHFWAFLLGPVWMLWRRLWLVLALLVGFEAGSLRRWTLTRRGWRNLGVVVGDDMEMAERHFYAAWRSAEARESSLTPGPNMPLSRERARETLKEARDIIGLFPEPGASR
jgi:hypothetical protein